VPEPLDAAREIQASLQVADIGEAGLSEQQEAFDRHWARTVMAAALNALRLECEARRGERVFAVLAPFLGGEGEVVAYETAAARLGVSVPVFKSDILRWRRKLRDLLRAEIMRTVSAPHEIEEELSYLRRHLMVST
jgi:hypothetical protein